MENSKGLLEALQLEKERLGKNHQVPVDELRNLVFTTYSCGMINEGRAVQGATIASKPSQIKVWEAQTPRKIRVLIENKLYSY